jgi:hypothetical protein
MITAASLNANRTFPGASVLFFTHNYQVPADFCQGMSRQVGRPGWASVRHGRFADPAQALRHKLNTPS